MSAQMQAVVLHGKEDLRVETVAVPQVGPGELLVRVGAALTCGTDLKVYRRGYHARMLVPPTLFGHEIAGTVVAAGEGVTNFAVGDRVVAAQLGAVWHVSLLPQRAAESLHGSAFQ